MPTAEELLSVASVRRLADVLDLASGHVRVLAPTLAPLGLSDRMRAVRDALLLDLPGGYPQIASVVRGGLVNPAFTGWMVWPVTEAVAVSATSTGDFDDGLTLLAALTPRLTSEFALRTFLIADLERTLATVLTWTGHTNPAVRRLASEGTRPRLPWAKRVPAIFARPEVTAPILDRLYTDPSDVVRRSVANHLNDISRLDAPLAVAIATRWAADPSPTTPAVIRHAMRTLVKQGDAGALGLTGFTGTPESLKVLGPVVRDIAIPFGGDLVFEARISNDSTSPMVLAVDYVVHFQKANGSLAPKVFKLAKRTVAPGEQIDLVRRHSFRQITTRRHYPGPHAVELQINGHRFGRAEFLLQASV